MSQYDKTDDCGNPEDKSTRQNYLEENPEKLLLELETIWKSSENMN